MLVVGNDDVDAGSVGVNAGSEQPERGVPVDFVERLSADVLSKT